MLIGEVAARTGLRPSTIRYYESRGLLPEPERIGGRRHYPEESVRTLSIIRTAQRAGLRLNEAQELLSASRAGAPVSERLQAIAERKLPEIDALIARAELVRQWLQAAAGCECPSLDDCPLFDPHEKSA
jgi:MerR family transcriptional regulator, redox-sensitive transcriptional activator SoxR